MSTAWSKTTKYIVGIALAILGVYLIYLSRSVISLLILAALLAVLVRPVVTWLHERARLPRGLAVLLVYLGVLILAPLAVALVIPAIVNAVRYVVELDYQSILQSAGEWLTATLTSFRTARLPLQILDDYLDPLVDALLAALETSGSNPAPQLPSTATILQSLRSALTTTFGAAADLVGAVLSSTLLLIFIMLASIYISLSMHTYRDTFLGLVPLAYRPEIDALFIRIGRVWNAFFRGQITLMIVIGLVSWLGLTILGVPGALYLAIIAGLLELIPNLGPLIATIPAVIVALLPGASYLPVGHLARAGLVIGLYILIQQLENNLIVPRVLGDAVELSPLVVMTGVLVGTNVGGILGALLATPLVATGREILFYIRCKLLGEDPYPPGEVLPPEPTLLEAVLPAAVIPPPSVRTPARFRAWLRRRLRQGVPAAGKAPSAPNAETHPSPGDEDSPPDPR